MKKSKQMGVAAACLGLCLSGCAGRNAATEFVTISSTIPIGTSTVMPTATPLAILAASPSASEPTVIVRPIIKIPPTPEPLDVMFSTSYKGGNKNRIHNIKRAAESINNVVLQPNEVFSYNETLGPTSKRNGYKKARVFVQGRDAEGYGGGVCQVSSTLYNAADMAGMEIIERHPHSKKVGYVKEDRDAATSYGGIDFRFRNTKAYAVRILASTDAENVTVRFVRADAVNNIGIGQLQ